MKDLLKLGIINRVTVNLFLENKQQNHVQNEHTRDFNLLFARIVVEVIEENQRLQFIDFPCVNYRSISIY